MTRRVLAVGMLSTALFATPAAAWGATVATWQLNEASGARTMVDSASAGGANNGTIVDVTTGVSGLVSGKAYTFGGNTSYVQVPDNAALDPGEAPITVRAAVRTVDGPMPDDSYDLVRKGVTTTAGGEWKMEIKRMSNPSVGYLHCVFKGQRPNATMVTVSAQAKVDVVDGKIHRLQCVRTASAVKAVVDGTTAAVPGASGSISNAEPVVIGSKSSGDDVLQGTLDEVAISVG